MSDLTAQREATHGPFHSRAAAEDDLLTVMEWARNWDGLSPARRSALRMIAVKISRILAGDPDEPDHWNDIAGYAELGGKND